jgi:protein XagA
MGLTLEPPNFTARASVHLNSSLNAADTFRMKHEGSGQPSGQGLNRIVRSVILVWFAATVFPIALHAGAWTQDARHGQLITTFSFFQTSRAYDDSGSVKRFGDDGSFRQFTINPYLEYGLSSRYTLILNAQVPFLRYSNSYGAQSSAGFGDFEFAVRRRLNAPESPWTISSQLTVMFPAYSATRNPAPGNHQEDIEARFMIGHGSTLFQRHVFWDAQAAYRGRFGAPADQFRTDLTVGIDITPHLMAMGQFLNSQSLRNGQSIETITNPNAQSDYDLHKCQLSLVIALPHKTRIQAGWNSTLSGRNTGRGQTAIIALWKSF